MAYDPNKEWEPNMPRVDIEGREIVPIVSKESPNGYRYHHKDAMGEGDKEYTGKIKISEPAQPIAAEPAPEPKTENEGWGTEAT